MTVGSDTFINSALEMAGLDNVFNHLSRYPTVTIEDINRQAPDVLLLSSEPFPFSAKHIEEISVKLSSTPVVLVDGEMFSWYGTRYLEAFHYFKVLHKQLATFS